MYLDLPNFSVKTSGRGADLPEPRHVKIMSAHFSRLHTDSVVQFETHNISPFSSSVSLNHLILKIVFQT